MGWTRYIFKDHRTHIVTSQLERALLHEMIVLNGAELDVFEPSYRIKNSKVMTEWSLDFGGSYQVGSPTEILRLRGLSITIGCHHVPFAIDMMRRIKPQRFALGGAVWYGLPHWHSATIMHPQQYQSMLSQLVAIAPRAESRDSEFWRTHTHIRELSTPVSMPDGSIRMAIIPSSAASPITS